MNRALGLDPKSTDARLALAGYLRKVTNDIPKAREESEAVLRLDPRNAEALGDMAVLDAITGQ